ncbi:HPr kinase/phosphatase C-terminal domain-containing protein [Rhodospirillaceae bacterium AH-315-P19]|nr:HPr kinase/phosphatase C-terminal domain-containing protein [Rhodospirillaceae bacterium AH-315-P19]
MLQVHGTSIVWKGVALLLRGPSGSGKSDLALRLVEAGGALIADDRTLLEIQEGRLIASAPPPISGLLEIRGIGIVKVASARPAALELVVDLVRPEAVVRMPEKACCVYLGITLPQVFIAPFEGSAVVKLRYAIEAARNDGRAA